jgi:hypothetical protein
MKVAAIVACLAVVTSVVAQDYVGTYSGTITITPTIYLIGDPNNVNTEISNQKLEVSKNYFGFVPNIPLYKNGDTVSVGINEVTFEPNGNFSAPERSYESSGMTFTDISGNVSGSTIHVSFRVLDMQTNGTLLDATFNYTGTKQTTGIKEVLSVEKAANIVGYYSLTGQKLNKEPENGFYVVVYDNGKSEKKMKK